MHAELDRLGSPQTLVGLDKVFCQDYVSDNSVLMQRMTATPPLPTPLSNTPKSIPLLVGEKLGKPPTGKRPSCQLRLAAEPAGTPLAVKLNNEDLGEGQMIEDDFREYVVPVAAVRHGNNDLTVAAPGAGEAGRLTRAHLWVRHSSE